MGGKKKEKNNTNVITPFRRSNTAALCGGRLNGGREVGKQPEFLVFHSVKKIEK
jgi:hypothetical protein